MHTLFGTISIAARNAVPLKAAALQFPRAHPAVACVLAGVRSTAELDENPLLEAYPMPAAFWSDLRPRALVASGAPLPGLP